MRVRVRVQRPRRRGDSKSHLRIHRRPARLSAGRLPNPDRRPTGHRERRRTGRDHRGDHRMGGRVGKPHRLTGCPVTSSPGRPHGLPGGRPFFCPGSDGPTARPRVLAARRPPGVRPPPGPFLLVCIDMEGRCVVSGVLAWHGMSCSCQTYRRSCHVMPWSPSLSPVCPTCVSAGTVGQSAPFR